MNIEDDCTCNISMTKPCPYHESTSTTRPSEATDINPSVEEQALREIVDKYITRETHKGSVNRIRHLMLEEIQTHTTNKVKEAERLARIDELTNVRLRPEPYTAREEADKYIVMRLEELSKSSTGESDE